MTFDVDLDNCHTVKIVVVEAAARYADLRHVAAQFVGFLNRCAALPHAINWNAQYRNPVRVGKRYALYLYPCAECPLQEIHHLRNWLKGDNRAGPTAKMPRVDTTVCPNIDREFPAGADMR